MRRGLSSRTHRNQGAADYTAQEMQAHRKAIVARKAGQTQVSVIPLVDADIAGRRCDLDAPFSVAYVGVQLVSKLLFDHHGDGCTDLA